MNRTDQASEPSMEELLASIRLIISDADRKSGALKEAGNARSAPVVAPNDMFAADEVLDLTEELVFPEKGSAEQVSVAYKTDPDQFPAAQVASPPERAAPAIRNAPAPPPSPHRAAKGPTNTAPRQETARDQVPPRPVWSRRELPFPGAPFDAPQPRARQEGAPGKSQARQWSDDIQMVIPEQGPVSLVLPGEQQGGTASGSGVEAAPAPMAGAGANNMDGDEEAAVAALAQKLARSAVGSMEAQELESAREFDFEHVDELNRAEVTQRFADAMEREDAALNKPALPSLLDEVLRQDFRRGAEPEPETEGSEDAGDQQPPEQPLMEEEALDTHFEHAQEPEQRRAQDSWSASPHTQGVAQARSSVNPAQSSPPVQMQTGQALVPSQAPMLAQPIRSLEDAVREMLRPLLVQWLNENMPRILENAIREEIAARGLIPGSDR